MPPRKAAKAAATPLAAVTAVSLSDDPELLLPGPFKRPGLTSAPTARRRALKQILAAERFDLVPAAVPTSSSPCMHGIDGPPVTSIVAAPSQLPRPKYCDLTGLPASYRDPKTGLNFYSAEVYAAVKDMAPARVQQYLALRGAVVKLG